MFLHNVKITKRKLFLSHPVIRHKAEISHFNEQHDGGKSWLQETIK